MQKPDEAGAIRELAERLLGTRIPFLPPEAQRTRLYPYELALELPLIVPMPSGSRLIGSAVQPRAAKPGLPPTGEAIDVVLDAPGTAEEILEFYERRLTRDRWSIAPGSASPRSGGFQSLRMPPSRMFCQGPQGPWLLIQAIAVLDGSCDVRIHVDTSGPGPCAAILEEDGDAEDPLPALDAPPGVPMQRLGAGGGPGVWSSTALALTEMSAAQMEAHVAGRFEAAGWERSAGAVQGPLAWSRWARRQNGDWQALLQVLEEAEPGRRLLHVRAESAVPPATPDR